MSDCEHEWRDWESDPSQPEPHLTGRQCAFCGKRQYNLGADLDDLL